MKKVFIPLVILLVCAFIFAGCSTATTTAPPATTAAKPALSSPPPAPSTVALASSSTASQAAAPAAATPQYGGTIKVAINIKIVNLGVPWRIAWAADGFNKRPAVEYLVGVNKDGSGNYIPQLATKWDIASDYKSITFYLRQGVKFHDGTDFNADVVKFNFDKIRTSKEVVALREVSSIDVIDNYTVRLNLSKYNPKIWPDLSIAMGGTCGIVSPAAINDKGEDYCMLHPVGTGPFVVSDVKADSYIKFKKFDGYWQKGKPYLDGLELDFINDVVTAEAAFQANEIQALAVTESKEGSDMKAKGYFTRTTPAGVMLLRPDSASSDVPFNNLKVRQAIAYALDVPAINKLVSYGLWTGTNQLAAPGTFYYNPNVVGYPYNPAKAKQLLTEAGYASGFKTSLYSTPTTMNKDAYTAVQGYLAAVGIDVNVQFIEGAAKNDMDTNGWHNALMQENCSADIGNDPGAVLLGILSKEAPGARPRLVYMPDDYLAKLNQANLETDLTKRQQLFFEVQKMIIDQYSMVWVTHNMEFSYAAQKNVNTDIYQYSKIQWAPEDAWLGK